MTDILFRLNEAGERVLLTAEQAEQLAAAQAPHPGPVPVAISDRQFAHGLWKREIITLAEAKAFVKVGELPATLAAIVAGLPDEIRDDVELLLSGATEFERANPFVPVIAGAFGWDKAAADDFWRFASTL